MRIAVDSVASATVGDSDEAAAERAESRAAAERLGAKALAMATDSPAAMPAI